MVSGQSLQHHTIAVIGAGISGLAAAHRALELCRDANRACSVTVFDAASEVGGVTGTVRRGDYLIETGADSFITNKPWAVNLCRRLGIEDRLIPTDDKHRRSLVLRNGRPTPVPDGFMLLSPAKVWPVLKSPLFSPLGKLRMGLEYFLPRKRHNEDESLADFVRRRFGKQALERLVQPLVGGIYTSDPEKLSLQATLPRFLEMERAHRSLIRASRKQVKRQDASEANSSGARYGLFASFDEGIAVLPRKLAERIREHGDIRLNAQVTKLSRSADRWECEFHDGTTRQFDSVIVALPAQRAADLLNPIAPELATELNQIEYASSSLVVTGHKLSDVEHPLNAFGLVVPAIENRKVLAVSFLSRKFPDRAPDGSVQLRTFVGGAMQPELLDRSDAQLLQVVLDELRQIFGVKGTPEMTSVTRYDRAMPQYHVGHLDRVAAIEKQVAALPGLELAGNAYRGVGIPDCVHSGEQAAERACTANVT